MEVRTIFAAVDSAVEALAVNTVAASTAVLPGTTTAKEADPASTAGTTTSEVAKAAQGCEASGATFAAGEVNTVVEAACIATTTPRAVHRCTGFRSGETMIWAAAGEVMTVACRPTEAEAMARTREDPDTWTEVNTAAGEALWTAAASIPHMEATRADRTM